mmetsp:Transcript_57717/g.151879  ORF Transcript_57717/g.151879 Transcript_57717/m.151879 type:complete len:283 (-) Transcript_57717:667-1515(-)
MVVALFWLKIISLLQSSHPNLVELIGVPPLPKLEWNTRKMLSCTGASGAFMGMLSTGNACLMFVQISFYQAAKSQHILCSLLLSYLWLKESQTVPVIASCLGVTAGFLINTFAEMKIIEQTKSFDQLAIGCAAGFLSSFFVALYPILIKQSMNNGWNKWQLSININSMSLLWFIPAIFAEFASGDLLSSATLRRPSFWALQSLAASAGFFLNIAAMLQVEHTSALTHMVVGSLKGGITSVVAVLLLGNRTSAASWVGTTLLAGSSLAYALARRAALPTKKTV